MVDSRAIGLAMYAYANDNDGKYPTGKSSTEVFQQLLDGEYISEPSILYIPMAGKFPGVIGAKLRPENVCFDLTADLTTNSPPSLPLVFSTGYKVTYLPGADAVPEIKPYPVYGVAPRTWGQWWNGEASPSSYPGIVIFSVDNILKFIPLSTATGTIPRLVPPEFTPDGKAYVQLTPTGPLK